MRAKSRRMIVVDLGHRADGRARILRGRLLLDGDRRRQAFDQIDIGLLHQLEELARIGREALDIAALAFGIDRVEGERRFAGAREPGDHHQAVARHIDVDVLEIVLAGAADPDFLHVSNRSVGFAPIIASSRDGKRLPRRVQQRWCSMAVLSPRRPARRRLARGDRELLLVGPAQRGERRRACRRAPR